MAILKQYSSSYGLCSIICNFTFATKSRVISMHCHSKLETQIFLAATSS